MKCLQVVSSLYLNGIVSSEGVQIDEIPQLKIFLKLLLKLIVHVGLMAVSHKAINHGFGLMLELCQKWDLFWHNISNL